MFQKENFGGKKAVFANANMKMLTVRIELTTVRLQVECSTN